MILLFKKDDKRCYHLPRSVVGPLEPHPQVRLPAAGGRHGRQVVGVSVEMCHQRRCCCQGRDDQLRVRDRGHGRDQQEVLRARHAAGQPLQGCPQRGVSFLPLLHYITLLFKVQILFNLCFKFRFACFRLLEVMDDRKFEGLRTKWLKRNPHKAVS